MTLGDLAERDPFYLLKSRHKRPQQEEKKGLDRNPDKEG
jgi:hypothetical protein